MRSKRLPHHLENHGGSGLHERQRKVLRRLLDDGDGGFLGSRVVHTDVGLVVVDEARESKESELNVRDALDVGGYPVSEKSGEQDRQYFGPVVAISTLHVAQDIGRRQAVIDDIRLLGRVRPRATGST